MIAARDVLSVARKFKSVTSCGKDGTHPCMVT